MKKINFIFAITLFFTFVFCTIQKSFSETTTLPIDTYTISLSGDALKTTSALNITVQITGGSAELKSGVTISDGKVTVTGKINPESISGNPIFSISKVEAAGGIDLTNSLTKSIVTSSSATTGSVCGNNKVEENETCDDGNTIDGDGCSATCQIENNLEPKPEPKPIPLPPPLPSTPSINFIGSGILVLTQANQRFAELVSVVPSNFTRSSLCKVSVSDRSLLSISPRILRISKSTGKIRIRGKVPFSTALELLDEEEFLEIVALNVRCRNGVENEKEIIITSDRICKRGEKPSEDGCTCAPDSNEEVLTSSDEDPNSLICTCPDDLVYTTNGCKAPVICRDNEIVTDENPCSCAEGASLNSNHVCECPDDQKYTVNGCVEVEEE